ncbi:MULTISPECIES: hypothetical protein [Legionella]|uniref:Uncharacterized protein n=1 Tax=Legionella drozanskii LLAP-1 TaxID=1212489 RepID=A0A0W0TBU2_9GAMM|nr:MULTISPECIES: hypothetical protein [Legionella]KTC93071.1 hypothetical protein Ldro_0442 [Legionella drozanskii LLAP-1]PJE11973.1 MAG: hypothetical protein CK430_08380 [Legionella sp.]
MKHSLIALGVLLSSSSFADSLSYKEVQLCTNAYNHVWFSFETLKSNLKEDPAEQLPQLITEFTKAVTSDIHFEVQKLPVPPDFTSTISIIVDGIADLANTAAFGIENFGEHHITSPFSVKRLPNTDQGHVYSMTTRDMEFTRDAVAEGGCTVYLSQKDVICTVQKGETGRKAFLSSIIDNVVTAYTIPAPQCALWNAAPITPYV